MKHPPPTVTQVSQYQTRLGWPGEPYHVVLSALDKVYLNVEASVGYRQLSILQRGFIATPTRPFHIARLTRRFLRVAWKLNKRLRVEGTQGLVAQALARM